MIRIQMKRYGKTVEIPVMSSSEDVYLALWKLGLDRDMAKYTMEGLEAVFLYDTPLEHQMIRTISSTMKLQDYGFFGFGTGWSRSLYEPAWRLRPDI